MEIGVYSFGAKRRYFEYESQAFAAYAAEHGGGVRGRSRESFDLDAAHGGTIFAGGPNEVADRLIEFHEHLGHSRHILQMDLGQMGQAEWLDAIVLLGSVVAPRVHAATGASLG
jgi:alkanesulfonate monooxygenase SsuD/methylene tetrahydromethanopterin reductase-like flavin-dependent oxidoreductase (luciferase family)